MIDLDDHEDILCELVDGVLVRKPMGLMKSTVASLLIRLLGAFCEVHDLGIVTGEAGMMKLRPDLIRIPDVSVILWNRLPGRRIPREPVPLLAPDVAIEVLSTSNTPGEMRRKLREYFEAGTQSVWLVDPPSRSVRIHRSATESRLPSGDDLVTESSVLPGFSVAVSEIFRRAGLE